MAHTAEQNKDINLAHKRLRSVLDTAQLFSRDHAENKPMPYVYLLPSMVFITSATDVQVSWALGNRGHLLLVQ